MIPIIRYFLKTLFSLYLNATAGGLFSVDEMKRGSIVIEYLGEVLPRSEAERRIKSIVGSRNYMLEVREHYADTVIHTYIDATRFGNESRFVNHSCDPNCGIQIV